MSHRRAYHRRLQAEGQVGFTRGLGGNKFKYGDKLSLIIFILKRYILIIRNIDYKRQLNIKCERRKLTIVIASNTLSRTARNRITINNIWEPLNPTNKRGGSALKIK
jgi:hypothetical protein